MKITKRQLKQIIREEKSRFLNEAEVDSVQASHEALMSYLLNAKVLARAFRVRAEQAEYDFASEEFTGTEMMDIANILEEIIGEAGGHADEWFKS